MRVLSGGREFDLCFITPTWRGDLERFALLRESLLAFGHGGVPHYAIVNTEDHELLTSRRLPGVIPVTTADILPGDLEQRREPPIQSPFGRRWQRFRRSLHKRSGWFGASRYYGWQIQQLIKLAAPVLLPHEVFVCFDSDIVVTGAFSLTEFVPEGKIALYEARIEVTPEQKLDRWYLNACRLLDQPLPRGPGDFAYNYVSMPFVFERQTTAALQAWLERRYGRPWFESVAAQELGAWSEFMTYGVFVRQHLKMAGWSPVAANGRNLWLDTEEQRQRAPDLIREVFENPDIDYLVLQADHHERWPVSRFTPLLREQLARVAARRARIGDNAPS